MSKRLWTETFTKAIEDTEDPHIINLLLSGFAQQINEIVNPDQLPVSMKIYTNKSETIPEWIVEDAINQLFSLMIDGELIMKNDIINKKLLTLYQQHFAKIHKFLKSATKEEILWYGFDAIQQELLDEAERMRYKPEGVKGLGICKRCQSENLHAEVKQTRSADEGMSTKYTCVDCGNIWKIG